MLCDVSVYLLIYLSWNIFICSLRRVKWNKLVLYSVPCNMLRLWFTNGISSARPSLVVTQCNLVTSYGVVELSTKPLPKPMPILSPLDLQAHFHGILFEIQTLWLKENIWILILQNARHFLTLRLPISSRCMDIRVATLTDTQSPRSKVVSMETSGSCMMTLKPAEVDKEEVVVLFCI